MRAQICPVCNKSGQYEGRKCHGCNGRGWVQVPEDQPMLWTLHPPYRSPGRRPARSSITLGR